MKQKQTNFSSTIGFLAAAAGSAVGLGNIWKFPYEVGRYGGASFLVLYIFCIVLLGYPLVVAELAFGRRMQAGPYKAYLSERNQKWGVLGFFITLLACLIFSFYNVITGWTLGYFVKTVCGSLLSTKDTVAFFGSFTKSMLNNLVYTLLSLLPITLIIKNGVVAGIERWSKILMPLFLVMLCGLIIYAFTLNNALKGLSFYLVPRLAALTPTAVYIALGQSFLSLSVGLGIMSTYGAYMSKKETIPGLAALITFSDTAVSFLTGLFLFPLIFSQQIAPGEGSPLVFISLPLVFQSLGPIVGTIIGGTFFLLFAFAAITSGISLLEVITAYFMERYTMKRSKAVYLVAIGSYCLSVPSMLSMGGSTFLTNFMVFRGIHYSFLDFVAYIVTEIALPLSCFLFIFFIVYRWKTKKLFLEIRKGSKQYRNSWLEKYLNVTITYVCPILLGLVVLLKVLQVVFGINVEALF